MKFSERMGITKVGDVLQVEDISLALRNSLWNLLDEKIWSKKEFKYSDRDDGALGDAVSRLIWSEFFKSPADARDWHGYEIVKQIRAWYFSAAWHEIYDFIEFSLDVFLAETVANEVNIILERESAGYRYISGSFVQVTSPAELESIQDALISAPYAGVEGHIKSALGHLARKQEPDFRNSIKESISAVESMAKEITGNNKATLGDALSKLESVGKFHPSLRKALSALYGYTSDEGGIRHAMLDEPKISGDDAKFMLVACSAFVNYMKSKI